MGERARRTLADAQRELAEVERHLREAPPHASGAGDTLRDHRERLLREVAALRRAASDDGRG